MSQRADLGGRDALVVSIVPLTDVFGDLNVRFGADAGGLVDRCGRFVFLPGETLAAAEAEEGKCLLGAVAGGDVAVVDIKLVGYFEDGMGMGREGSWYVHMC